jgi:putative ABC transport system permease protein
MTIPDLVNIAVAALARNKLRAILTTIGITIGIGAVICTVAIGRGGADQIQRQLAALGDNLVWVESGGRNVQGLRTGNDANKSLTLDDAKAILEDVPLIKSVSPNVDGRVQIVYQNQNWNTSYRGDSPDYLDTRRWTLASGSMFSRHDVDTLANVCVLGHSTGDILFGSQDGVGQTIRVNQLPCKVVGILDAKGTSADGRDQDDFILLPVTTAMHKLAGKEWLDDIYCSAVSPGAIEPAQQQIERLMRQRHKLRADEPDDFNIRHPEDALKAQQQASLTMEIMLAAIASVSLLVGGIGIMNIMLVSVTERTREIGVRMAIGATEQDVQIQFLFEAVFVSLLGGTTGIAFGVLASAGFSSLLGWTMEVSPEALIIAVLFSTAIGVCFGYYPAKKAASLDPIEALRYE